MFSTQKMYFSINISKIAWKKFIQLVIASSKTFQILYMTLQQ